MTRNDTEAWYRQFWPWFIISLPASAVIAGLYTVWLSLQTVDTVVDRNAQPFRVVTVRSGTPSPNVDRPSDFATIEIEVATGAVTVMISNIPADEAPRMLRLELRHATMASRDRSIDLQRSIAAADGSARYAGHFAAVPVGRHYVMLSSDSGLQWASTWAGARSIRADASR